MPLTDRAENVLLQLKLEGIGSRPLVFVAHSMGGLLVKQLLRTAKDSTDPKDRAILEMTRGVCFIATPHIGSELAKWGTYFRTLLGANVAMDELRPHEPLLRNLKKWYSDCVSVEHVSIKTLSFYEMKPLPGMHFPVVEASDADPGVPTTHNYPLDEDHGSICRPESKSALLYRAIKSFIRDDCFEIIHNTHESARGNPAELVLSEKSDILEPMWPPVANHNRYRVRSRRHDKTRIVHKDAQAAREQYITMFRVACLLWSLVFFYNASVDLLKYDFETATIGMLMGLGVASGFYFLRPISD